MIEYMIVDDEYVAHEIIEGYCNLLPNMKLALNCYDALEAFEYLGTHSVDLIFLDLNMPILKGFDFIRALKSTPKIIVTTAYREFALEGYELNVADYLLKPFSFERFLKAMNHTFSSSKLSMVAGNRGEGTEVPARFFLKTNKKYVQVTSDRILFLESNGNYAKVITQGETLIVREKVADILQFLPKEEFLQVHKSFAVAIKYIKSIEGNQIFIDDYVVPIGKLYRKQLITTLQLSGE